MRERTALTSRLTDGRIHAARPHNDKPAAKECRATVVTSVSMFPGAWEPTEVNSVLWGLHDVEQQGVERPVFLDVGSNIGVFALSAAVVGYDVIAFEAMERNQQAIYSTLCANPALHERVTLLPYALGASNAACTMFSDSQNVADGHVACTEEARDDLLRQLYTERSSMHVVTLGDYMDDVPVHVMKVRRGRISLASVLLDACIRRCVQRLQHSIISSVTPLQSRPSSRKAVRMQMDVEGHESKILEARGAPPRWLYGSRVPSLA